MSILFWIWLAILIITVIVELSTASLVAIWFSVGSAFALLLSLSSKVPWYAQVIVFILVSIIFLLSLRKISLKLLNKKLNLDTNLDLLVEKEAIVVSSKSINNMYRVRVNDVEWNAYSLNSSDAFSIDEIVKIEKIDGNKLIIKKIASLEN